MGRKTWESLGGPLPDRTNIVVTRQKGYVAEGATVKNSVYDALYLTVTLGSSTKEVMVIGGAGIYEAVLPIVDRMYITDVDAYIGDGDTFFPHVEMDGWQAVDTITVRADNRNNHNFTSTVYERRKHQGGYFDWVTC